MYVCIYIYILGDKSDTLNAIKFGNIINVSEREATKLVGECDVSSSSPGFAQAPRRGDAQALSK
jgi:hypothetical protein